MTGMHRRDFLRATLIGSGLAVLGSLPVSRPAGALRRGYGPLGPADANGVQLPAGFVSRVVAVSGVPVDGTSYVWHDDPDGGATFPQSNGGWIYVSNSESGEGRGGASMVRFDRSGSIVEAGSILAGTRKNCAGGATPWGTWLSCEEFGSGQVWECDPTGAQPARVRPAMGAFSHEAAAADAVRRVIYLTEDRSDGALYRFVPTEWGDLSEGALEVLTEFDDVLGWATVPDPSGDDEATRHQVENAVRFDGGEGAWFDGDVLYFTTKGDNRVWRYDPAANDLDVVYDIDTAADPVLQGVDNVTVDAYGDVYVCEDGGNMEVVILTPEGAATPFLRVPTSGSELTGVAFDPTGTRLYLSSQRNPGTTYEIRGPFGSTAPPAARLGNSGKRI